MPNSKSRRLTEFNARTELREFEDAGGDLGADKEEGGSAKAAEAGAAEHKPRRTEASDDRPS